MTFTLKPDDNGIVVVLTDVAENDIKALENAEKQGFDPTEEPFSKYYKYDKIVGFHVNEDHFDHAEHKGKRLSFNEYMKMISNGEIDLETHANDAEYDIEFILNRINEIKKPKTVSEANAALSNLNFATYQLTKALNDVDDSYKEKLHKALDHGFEIYDASMQILKAVDFASLIDLDNQLDKNRNLSAQAQSKLLEKFNENF